MHAKIDGYDSLHIIMPGMRDQLVPWRAKMDVQ